MLARANVTLIALTKGHSRYHLWTMSCFAVTVVSKTIGYIGVQCTCQAWSFSRTWTLWYQRVNLSVVQSLPCDRLTKFACCPMPDDIWEVTPRHTSRVVAGAWEGLKQNE